MSNINSLSLQNSETSSSASSPSQPPPLPPPNRVMNEYIKNATERMVHLSLREVVQLGKDGIVIVQLHNTFDFGGSLDSTKQQNCAHCAVVCASGCACSPVAAGNNFKGVKNGRNRGRGARGFGPKSDFRRGLSRRK